MKKTVVHLARSDNFWGVAFGSPKIGWLVGTEGRILRIDFSGRVED